MKNLFILFFLMCKLVYSQSDQTELKTLNYIDATIKVYVYINNPNISYLETKEYFWYTEKAGIKSTKGATGGLLLHGEFNAFDKDGNLIVQENYSNGLKQGKALEWNIEGEIIDKKIYEQGRIVYWKSQENNDGKLYYVERIGHPFFEDTLRTYDEHGILVRENILINDTLRIKLNLIYHKYSKQLSHKFFTQWHTKFGEYVEYYENGIISAKGNYANSSLGEFKIGKWIWYDESGKTSSTKDYKLYQEKYENENVKIIGSLIYDKDSDEWIRQDTWRTFYEDGSANENFKYSWGTLEE